MTLSVDVAIVGAGTAGAAAAAFCAERGLKTVCLERAPLARAGAAWVNGVPGWAFARARLAAPQGDELRGGVQPVRLFAGWGPRHIVIDDHGVLEVDMRKLVARLQALALRHGATLHGETSVHGVDGAGLHTSRGTYAARWIVDASGLAGAHLLRQPRVPARHLCAAAQEVRTLVDPAAARAYFEQHGGRPGDVLCFAGIAGGFSVLNLRYEHDEVSLLTGSIPALGHPSGKALIDAFVARQPWIGERRFGGARAIPLRRPFDRLTDGRVILLGDAGSQVFPAHGSGIGPGLVAARMLADALADGRGAHGHAVAWQREFGAQLASYDLLRRFSMTLSIDDVARMMDTGLMDASLTQNGMRQTMPSLPLAAVPGKLRALARAPRLASRLGAVAARMVAVRALYASYPAQPARLGVWSRLVARVYDEAPDQAA